jgi:hypothetical protein
MTSAGLEDNLEPGLSASRIKMLLLDMNQGAEIEPKAQ